MSDFYQDDNEEGDVEPFIRDAEQGSGSEGILGYTIVSQFLDNFLYLYRL